MMEEGYPNPLEGKFTLDRHKGIKVIRGATNAKEPHPVEALRNILEQTRGAPLMVRAAALTKIEQKQKSNKYLLILIFIIQIKTRNNYKQWSSCYSY